MLVVFFTQRPQKQTVSLLALQETPSQDAQLGVEVVVLLLVPPPPPPPPPWLVDEGQLQGGCGQGAL